MNAVATPRSVPESWSLANLAVSQSLQSHGTSVYVIAAGKVQPSFVTSLEEFSCQLAT